MRRRSHVSGISWSTAAIAQSIEEHFFGNAIEAGVIAIDGPMTKGLTDRLRRKIAKEGIEARRVLLNSPGGSLLEGISLGRLIRERGWSTEVGRLAVDQTDPTGKKLVPGECFSACALAFLGGSYRQPESALSLGFHQFHEGGKSYTGYELAPTEIRAEGLSDAQVISGLIVTYMVEMDVDARLFTASSGAGPSDLIRFTIEEAMEFGVVTPRHFGRWVLEPYKQGVVAASKRMVATGPYDLVTQSTAFCRSPGSVPSLLMTVDYPGENPSADRLAGHEIHLTISPRGDAPEQTVTVPASQVEAFRSGKRLQIELTLSADLAARIARSAAFGLQLAVPRVLGGYAVSHVLSGKDRDMIDAAFRLCI